MLSLGLRTNVVRRPAAWPAWRLGSHRDCLVWRQLRNTLWAVALLTVTNNLLVILTVGRDPTVSYHLGLCTPPA